jgi:hypothetical protein
MTVTRIALLKCGDLKGKAYEQNGGYNDIYHNWLKASVPQFIKFTLDSYDVVQGVYPNESLYDCIMLTGSGIAQIAYSPFSL